MLEAQKIEGRGPTLDDALKQALNDVDAGNGADIMVVVTVESFGIRGGGFDGVVEFWVKASYALG